MKKIIVALGFLGIVGASTMLASAAYFDTYSYGNTCGPSITRFLQIGSENDDVYTLQQVLVREGYLYATPNGHFGPATRSAVRSFQADNGLYVSGQVGEATRDAINAELCSGVTNSYNYNTYNTYNTNYASGVTYVDPRDPYVNNVVVTPPSAQPVVYTNPGTVISTPSYTTPTYTSSVPQAVSTNIMYTSSIGYTYGITPQPGILTISTPRANAVYNEGDTVNLSWSTNNLPAYQFQVVLENTSTGVRRIVTQTSGNTASFSLSKVLLDDVCGGTCTQQFMQNSFRIVVETPVTDIAGNTSTLRAMVSPVTINRPYAFLGTVSLTASKTPINSGEPFRLYVNIPIGASWDANIYGQYTFRIHALCPNGITVSIAGTPCGQDFSLPFTPSPLQQDIPAVIVNSTWIRQDVTFEIVVSNLAGQVLATSQTKVTVNGTPFSW